jgi:hypothetical protein
MKHETNIEALHEAKERLELEYNKKHLAIEISITTGSRVAEELWERKIIEYSLSSSNRRKFMMYAVRASYDNEPITYNQLKKLLGISDGGLTTMWKECSDAGWIVTTQEKRAYQTLLASDNLVKAYNNYMIYVRQNYKDSGLRTLAQAIVEMQHLIEHEDCENR